MKRKRTSINVWPAITDLMTAILVIAFLTGMVTIAYNSSYEASVVDSSEYEAVLIQVDSLMAVIKDIEAENKSLKAVKDIVGSRSCLGKEGEKNVPNSLMTIRITPNGYYIKANYAVLNNLREETQEWRGLMENIDRHDDQELSKLEMTLFAKELSGLGKSWPDNKDCKFSPTFEDGGVSPDFLHDAWYKFLDTYFGPLTNPSILPSY